MSTLAPSFLIGSYSFLHVTRTVIKAWIEFEFLPYPIANYWISCPWAFEKWMYNVVSTLAPLFLIWSYSILHVTRTVIKAWMGLKFGKIGPGSTDLAALERLKKSPLTYNGRNVVSTLVLSFLNGSSSFLQVTRTAIKACMILNFCQIPSPTTELAALERLKNECIMLWAL